MLLTIRNVDQRDQRPESAPYSEAPNKRLTWNSLIEEVVKRTVGTPPIPTVSVNVPVDTTPGTVKVDAKASDIATKWHVSYCWEESDCQVYARALRNYWKCRQAAATAPKSGPTPAVCDEAVIPSGVIPSSRDWRGKGEKDGPSKSAGTTPKIVGESPKGESTDGVAADDAHAAGAAQDRLAPIFGGMQTLFQLRPQAIDLSETETAFRARRPGYYLVTSQSDGGTSGELKHVFVRPFRNQVGLSVGAGNVAGTRVALPRT